MAYKTAVNERVQSVPPALFIFGHGLRTTANLLYRVSEEKQRNLDHFDYVETLQTKTEKVHNFSRENLRIASDKMKRLYGVRSHRETFKRGDLLWFHNPRRKKDRSPNVHELGEGCYVDLNK